MNWNTLSDTLIELARAIVAPPGVGLVVTEAELSVPLEVRLERSRDGLQVFAQPAHSRWKSGFLPPTHMSGMTFVLESGDGR